MFKPNLISLLTIGGLISLTSLNTKATSIGNKDLTENLRSSTKPRLGELKSGAPVARINDYLAAPIHLFPNVYRSYGSKQKPNSKLAPQLDKSNRKKISNKDNVQRRKQARSGEAMKQEKAEYVEEITLPPMKYPRPQESLNGPRISVLTNQPKAYYPATGALPTVCHDKSTIYNIPKVKNWLKRKVYAHSVGWQTQKHSYRPIWYSLRMQIFTQGRSEECHVVENDKWKLYLECALQRNMRLEYLIPQYPLHQIGYNFDFSVTIDENPYTGY